MSGTRIISAAEIDQYLGEAFRYIDVYIKRDRVVEKANTNDLKSSNGSVSAYINSLFTKYEVNEFSVDIFRPNGSTKMKIDTVEVTRGPAPAIGNTGAGSNTPEPEKNVQPPAPTPPAIKFPPIAPKENKPAAMTNLQNTAESFYGMQTMFLQNQYDTLKLQYAELLTQRNKLDDENRELKTKLAIADGMKTMEVLTAKNEASSTLQGTIKEVSKPESIEALAKLVEAIKGVGSKEGGSSYPTLDSLTPEQKEAVLAIVDVVKAMSNDERENFLKVTILSTKMPEGNYFTLILDKLRESGVQV